MKSNHEIISLPLTTNNETPSGQSVDIIVDSDKKHMINGQSLFRVGPNGKGIFIVRTNNGLFTRRHGKDGVGVSLSSYLFGRTYMHRINPSDHEDYTAEAFLPNGRPSMIELLRTPDSHRVHSRMYQKEFEEYEKQAAEQASKSKKRSKQNDEPPTEDLHTNELVGQIERMEKARVKNRKAAVGAELKCPQCGKKFTKNHALEVFCSSYRRPGPNGEKCKDTYNTKLAALRRKVEPIGAPEPKPSVAAKADYHEHTNGLHVTTENGREVRMDADTLLKIDAERLRIIFGTSS